MTRTSRGTPSEMSGASGCSQAEPTRPVSRSTAFASSVRRNGTGPADSLPRSCTSKVLDVPGCSVTSSGSPLTAIEGSATDARSPVTANGTRPVVDRSVRCAVAEPSVRSARPSPAQLAVIPLPLSPASSSAACRARVRSPARAR